MLLDPLLILGIGPFPRLEVTGAAIATVSSQILVFLILVLRIRCSRLESNILQHLHLLSRFSKEYYEPIFRIGFPTAIQSSIYCMISMILTRMVSSYGAAGYCRSARRRTDRICILEHSRRLCLCPECICSSELRCTGKKDRIRKCYSLSFRILVIWGLLVTSAFVFLPGPIAGLFFHEKEALAIAVNYLIIIGFSETFMSVELMTIGALSGLGLHQTMQSHQRYPHRCKDPSCNAPYLGRHGIEWDLVGAYCFFCCKRNHIYLNFPSYQQTAA